MKIKPTIYLLKELELLNCVISDSFEAIDNIYRQFNIKLTIKHSTISLCKMYGFVFDNRIIIKWAEYCAKKS
jgi:hypothetical protein